MKQEDNAIPTINKKRKLGTDISKELYTDFKQVAALKYNFQRGYTHLALIEAIENYIEECKKNSL